MSGPGTYGPGPGGYPAPQQGYDQPVSPPPRDDGYNDSQYHRGHNSPPPQQHAAYDPHTGYPIPPGYVPPSKPPPATGYDPNNFPPPPQQEYRDDGYGPPPPRSDYDRGYDRAPPSDYGPTHSGYGNDGRQYAPSESERYQHEGNQLTPYDEEKAEAEYYRGLEEQQRRNVPPPPSDYELRNRRYGDRGYDDRYDDRYSDRYSDDRDRRSYDDDRSSYDDRRRRSEGRRRDSRHSPPKTSGKKDIFGGKEGERGLGAQILGGAVGGIAGHELGGGVLETLAGVAAGAIGAKVLENQHEKRKDKKEEQKRAVAPYAADMVPGERISQPSSRWPRDGRGGSPRERRRSGRRRSDSDSYSSDGSRTPPPRRR